MFPRVMTVTFVSALVIGAYAGCGERDGHTGRPERLPSRRRWPGHDQQRRER